MSIWQRSIGWRYLPPSSSGPDWSSWSHTQTSRSCRRGWQAHHASEHLARSVPAVEMHALNSCISLRRHKTMDNYTGNTQTHIHTHTRLIALFQYYLGKASTRKIKTNLYFTEARDSERQWHQLGHMQVCTALQTDNHASTRPLNLQTGCPSCCPINSVKAYTSN